MVPIQSGERIDFLPNKQIKIIQASDVFSFSIDAVLLAKFASVPIQKGRLIDLCSGNGVIPLLLSERSKGEIVGVELQERLYDMAERSMKLNELSHRINMLCANINDLPIQGVSLDSFDIVTCNPPYFEVNEESDRNVNEHLLIARHEVYCTLDDVIRICSRLVKQKGKVALVHRPERLADIFSTMKKYRIEPKRMQLVYPTEDKDANIVLVEGIKDGKKGLKCLPPIIVYGQDRKYTKEFEKIYNG